VVPLALNMQCSFALWEQVFGASPPDSHPAVDFQVQ
jgi:hypothetical protein